MQDLVGKAAPLVDCALQRKLQDLHDRLDCWQVCLLKLAGLTPVASDSLMAPSPVGNNLLAMYHKMDTMLQSHPMDAIP